MDEVLTIRHARMPDAQDICEIINFHAERGRMLHRSLEKVYEKLRTFLIAERGEQIVGCVSVEIAWADLAEVRSLAVRDGCIGLGIGRKLIEAAIEDARNIGLRRLFALTYEQAFFERLGFTVIDRFSLPSKVWMDCAACPKREACDEIAVLLEI